jgi:IclR family acetate operon transcriptional repressor
LPASTPATITDSHALAGVVEETRRRGWAINRGELFPEAGALAVPILDAAGTCVAALGLNIPLSRLTDGRVRVLVEDLQGATRRLTPAFGFGLAGPSVAPASG